MTSKNSEEKGKGEEQVEVEKSTANQQPRRRKTGCITCRVRRVKCDEARPNCSRCQSTGRNCDGYSAAPVTRRQISQLLRSGSSLGLLRNPASGFDNDRESSYFDYFRSSSAPKSTTFYGSDFWLRRVLQMTHSEPAIKHATLALGALHRCYEFEQWPQPEQELKSALLYYSRAVSQTKNLLLQNTRENTEKLLVICLLFMCYENTVGNFPAAQMHLQHGLCILSESRKQSPGGQSVPNQDIPDDILHAFSRMDLQAMALSDSSAPYPFSTVRVSEPSPIPSSFSSIAEAQYHLFENFKRGWVEEEMSHLAGVEVPLPRQSWLASRLTTWESSFAALQSRLRETSSVVEVESELLITRIYHEMIAVTCNSGFFTKEMSYDAYYAKFELLLTLVDSLPVMSGSPSGITGKPPSKRTLSFESGVVLPLYFTATRCRDPRLRRQALARLYALHSCEGVWDSLGAARVAERIIDIEEEGQENIRRAEDISSEKRVAEAHVVVNLDRRLVFLTCTFNSNPNDGTKTKSDVISF
ncbi:hypothetical protein MMC07_001055 [Pseudocyphellaria aurata]|nr:hypothetical protein [Pseudocyphellaria aurata]